MEGRDWRSVAEYRNCCVDWLSEAAPPLNGQKIFLTAAPNARVRFSFERPWLGEEQHVTFALRNQLSAASAATLLHFIRHTEKLYFKRVSFPVSSEIENAGAFNPAVLSAASGNGARRWVHSLSSERQIGGFFDSRRFTDLVVFGSYTRWVPTAYITPAFIDNIVHFITQGGRCMAGEVVINFDIDNSSIRDSMMPFFERLVKV